MTRPRILLLALLAAAVTLGGGLLPTPGTHERASDTHDGNQADAGCWVASCSSSGRWITFFSEATNLVPGDTNAADDVFLVDRKKDTITRISVTDDGTEGNAASDWPSLSGNGRWVVFESDATNLVPGDTNGFTDIFVHDRKLGTVRRVSVSTDGTQADDDCERPHISANGKWIAFESTATNLVAGDTNGESDLFLHRLGKGTTERVEIAGAGVEADDGSFTPRLSANGRHIAFLSQATNLVAGDTNGNQDAFVHDSKQGTTVRVSVTSDGTEASGSTSQLEMSANGRWVVMQSSATNLVPGDVNFASDGFLHDLKKGATTMVTVADDGTYESQGCFSTHISPNGRFVSWSTNADNLVAGDGGTHIDAFLRDVKKGTTVRLSQLGDGSEADANSFGEGFSRSGRLVIISSDATNLAGPDTNGTRDLFAMRRP